MSGTTSTALTLLVVCWIFSLFLGAGPKGLVRAIGTVLSVAILFLEQIISTVLGVVLGLSGIALITLIAIGLYRLIFGSRRQRQARRYWRQSRYSAERGNPFHPLNTSRGGTSGRYQYNAWNRQDPDNW